MNLIQVTQVNGLAASLTDAEAYTTAVSGHLEDEIWVIMTGDSYFTGNKTFKDSVTFLSPVTGASSGNFVGGLWVDTDKVVTAADTGNLFVTLVNDQDITGVKTFQGAGGSANSIFKGGTVYVNQWGTPGEAAPALRITGELWITGSDGSPVQLTSNSPWAGNGDDIYFNDSPSEAGNVGIATDSPSYNLDVAGTGNLIGLRSQSVVVGAGAAEGQQLIVEQSLPFDPTLSGYFPSGGGVQTGALLCNLTNTAYSTTALRMSVDLVRGYAGYGAVDLIAKREDSDGTSSFAIHTNTGLTDYIGLQPRFQISGASATFPCGLVGIGKMPQHALDVEGVGRVSDVYDDGLYTGLTVLNATSTGQSSSIVRLGVDDADGAGDFGAVNLVATREDTSGTSSFAIQTKSGNVAGEGFSSRFYISGAGIFVDHDAMPLSNPEVRGQLWLKPTTSYTGNSYLMVSSGVAPP